MHYLSTILTLSFVLTGISRTDAQESRAVFINQVRLSEEAVLALEHFYQTHIPGGLYWYDPISGLWGIEGGPAAGRIMPYLELGGPLRADASGGGTDVFINGRELHPLEVHYLQQLFGTVIPGRYWLNAQGIGGYEDGPPLFDLAAAAARAGDNGYTYQGPGGLMGSDGTCFYYSDPETGASYMPPGC